MSPVIPIVNPVLARELMKRMRGPKAMLMRSGYLGFLGLIFVLVYHVELAGGTGGRFGASVVDWARIGQRTFEWTLMLMLVMVLFLVPGFTAGSIVGERQRQTLVPLQISLMRPLSIVLGKLGASVVFTLLLLLGTTPLLTVAHMIGGITFMDIVKGLGMIMFLAICIAATSLLFSTAMKSSAGATVMSYVMVQVLLTVVFVTVFFVSWTSDPSDEQTSSAAIGSTLWSTLAMNPIAALADAVGEEHNAFRLGDPEGSGPLSAFRHQMQAELDLLNDSAGLGFMPLWMLNVLIYSALAVVSVARSCWGLSVPVDRER